MPHHLHSHTDSVGAVVSSTSLAMQSVELGACAPLVIPVHVCGHCSGTTFAWLLKSHTAMQGQYCAWHRASGPVTVGLMQRCGSAGHMHHADGSDPAVLLSMEQQVVV